MIHSFYNRKFSRELQKLLVQLVFSSLIAVTAGEVYQPNRMTKNIQPHKPKVFWGQVC